MEAIIGDYEGFIGGIDARLKRWGIRPQEISLMDHLCYRVETGERYQELLKRLAQYAFLIDESMVAGRPIATFQFDSPLTAHGWSVPYLELPHPKDGSPYGEGLQHAEVVIDSLDRLRRVHPFLPFDDRGMRKLINPELRLSDESPDSEVFVNFHELSLGAAVRIEQRMREAGYEI